ISWLTNFYKLKFISMKQKLLSLLMIGFMLIGSAFAQDKRITGRVTSSDDGLPLAGVSVEVSGGVGVMTDDSGVYVIHVPQSATTLTFSNVGYATQTINIGTSTTINVVLVSTETELDEIVVVAYGTQRKRDLIGSVSTVS